MSNEVFIKIIAEHIVSEVLSQTEDRTFEWLDNRIRELISQVAGMGDSDIPAIRHLVNQEVKIYTNPTHVVATKEEREHLITLERLNENDYYWQRFNKGLQSSLKKQVAAAVNDDVNRICLQLPDPAQADDFLCKGMVIGDVQAGKTNNYTGLINKAADVGYRLIIILTGVTEPLRSQTQQRLDKDFVGMESVASKNAVRASHQPIGVGKDANSVGGMIPHSVTDSRVDFRPNNSVRVENHKTPVLLVTKKNHTILNNILRWLESQKSETTGRFELPTLIVDDEADNASVNTADEGEDPKAINRLIRSILASCSKVSYVAYTATPFANVFIDPDADSGGMVDLFPSHFIVCLNPPSNYCGGKFFYASDDAYEESRYVRRSIYDCESYIPLGHKSDHSPNAIPPSMKEAIASFFVAAAIKDIRRENGLLDRTREKFDSCLINVSRFTAVQSDLAAPVEDAAETFWSAARTGNAQCEAYQQMGKVFTEHYQQVVGVNETWEQVTNALRELEQPVVKIVHSKTKDDLDYKSEDAPTKIIAIGGFKLSRGLTLDGLTVSYFYRRSMMYDTLMQMARWFGYRDGYRDLLRLYTTPDARAWYDHITEASEELKRELIELEGVGEPKDFGIKVRSHEDSLIVTAKNKMRTATEISSTVSFANKLKETFFVDRRAEINRKNLTMVTRFFDEVDQDIHRLEVNGEGLPRFLMLDSVPAGRGLQLLRSLDLDWGNEWARTNRLIDYLANHAADTFQLWDVAFQSSTADGAQAVPLSERLKVGVQVRRPLTLARPRPVGPTMSHEIRHSLALGDNRKVSSTSIDYVGIPEDVLDRKPELKKRGPEARLWKKNNRPNPLLIFHLIKLDLEGSEQRLKQKIKDLSDSVSDELRHQLFELESFKRDVELDEYYLATSISIPGNDKNDDGVSYQINKREYEERFGVFEYDE